MLVSRIILCPRRVQLIVSTDWSHDQLEKHSREIMSLLGNLYLRITSKKIQKRVEDETRPSLVDIARRAPEESSLQDLITTVDRLHALVQERMQGLLVADALDDIMLTLQKVRHAMPPTCAMRSRSCREINFSLNLHPGQRQLTR